MANFFVFSLFRQKKEFVLIFTIMFVGAVLEAVGIGAILPLISLMGQPNYMLENPDISTIIKNVGVASHEEMIIFCVGLLMLFYLLKNLYISWGMVIQRRYAKNIQCFYAKEIFTTYLAKPYDFHLNTNSANILRDVCYGATNLFNNILMPIFGLASELITALVIWIMLLTVDVVTATIVALIMGLIIVSIIRSFRKKIVQQGRIQNDASVGYLKWINQGLGSIKETKILGKERFFLSNYVNSYRKYAEATQRYLFLLDIPRVIIEMVVVIGLLLLIVFKIILGEHPADIIPILGVLAMAAFRLMPSANRIVSYYNTIKNQMPFFYEIHDVLIEIKERLVVGNAEVLPEHNVNKLPFEKYLRVDNVSFRYMDSGNLILDKVSFDIIKGGFVGIIGPSGAGKTTFVDILLGLLRPTEGKILCDGQDINDDIMAWQANLAYVPQDIYLTDGTIRENIALGEKYDDIDDELLNDVLDMSELSDYIKSLPDGLDTLVGERGAKISGGQRQRIGIARALYQKPKVLILDEATSALDNETEKAITDTILKFKGKITIIAIAHRVSTLEACDYKVKLENGKAEIIK
ncbi:ABC transporter permease [Anaerovibrio lipolyticus]|uniref:ABC transporter permease n=1 Tax=Anaerovibrio lipolyticus TaxID=82374 RepID=A0A0B2K3F1_9FIRM|nr:ABC transporter permease [Anaerovibrio lipolyticus]